MPSVTLTITDDQLARIKEAYGAKLELGRDATPAEVKQEIINEVKRTVIYYERDRDRAVVPPPADVEVT